MSCLETALLAACLLNTSAEGDLERYAFIERHMGVPFQIVLYCGDETTANKAAEAAFDRIEQLDAVMSDYEPDSELMQLCKNSGPAEPVHVSSELLFVLTRSKQLARRTDGAFDVTVGPLVQLWRKARRRKKLPEAQALRAAQKHVGYEAMQIDKQQSTVELRKPKMRLDLGGIAKGYAGDEALKVLGKHGIDRALIDGGGDIVLGDAPPGRDGWRIGIASLDKPEETSDRLLQLADVAVATSGDAYQYVRIEGKRYSHILNPKTGLGLTTRRSVTVVAPSGWQADSLASALSVLGPQKGLKLIDKTKGAAALVAELHAGKLQTFTSSRWDALDR